MGPEEGTTEACFFNNLSYRVLGSWKRDLQGSVPAEHHVLSKLVESFLFVEKYIGGNYFYKYEKGLWGFKDTEGAITLPLIYRLFPNLKIVHMVRNPYDVAITMCDRMRQDLNKKNIKRWVDLCKEFYKRVINFRKEHQDLLYILLTYEGMCLNWKSIFGSVFGQLQIPFTDEVKGYIRENIKTDRVGLYNRLSEEEKKLFK